MGLVWFALLTAANVALGWLVYLGVRAATSTIGISEVDQIALAAIAVATLYLSAAEVWFTRPRRLYKDESQKLRAIMLVAMSWTLVCVLLGDTVQNPPFRSSAWRRRRSSRLRSRCGGAGFRRLCVSCRRSYRPTDALEVCAALRPRRIDRGAGHAH
jgi:hypothetical protein